MWAVLVQLTLFSWVWALAMFRNLSGRRSWIKGSIRAKSMQNFFHSKVLGCFFAIGSDISCFIEQQVNHVCEKRIPNICRLTVFSMLLCLISPRSIPQMRSEQNEHLLILVPNSCNFQMFSCVIDAHVRHLFQWIGETLVTSILCGKSVKSRTPSN